MSRTGPTGPEQAASDPGGEPGGPARGRGADLLADAIATAFPLAPLDDPSPFELDGTHFVLGYGPESTEGCFTLVKTNLRQGGAEAVRQPLSRLAIQLVLAQAAWTDAVEEVSVNRYWLSVRRGPAELDPTTFRVGDLSEDHFGLDPAGRDG